MATHLTGFVVFGMCCAVLGIDLWLISNGAFLSVFFVTGFFFIAVLVLAILIELIPAVAVFFMQDPVENQKRPAWFARRGLY